MDFYLWATSRCAQKEHCRSEMGAKLKTKGASPDEVTSILNRLEAESYINEARYAAAFASDKFRFDHWGRTKIRYALRQKGIPDHTADEAMECIPGEAYQAALAAFIAAKRANTKAPTAYGVNQKIARAAIAKGYEPSLVFSALKIEE